LYFGVAHSSLEDMDIDSQGVPGTIGTQYNSNNHPPSSFDSFRNIVWRECHIGFVDGAADNVVTPTRDFEADEFRLDHFIVYGPPGDATAEGVHINSPLAAQGSVIALGNVQLVHIGVHILSTKGVLTISELTGGTVPLQDSTAALLQFDSQVAWSPNLTNDESESTWAFSVHDSSCNPLGTPGSPVWIGNQWNNNVLVDGCERVTSIGSGTGNGLKTAAGTSRIVSINDVNPWVASGGGKVTTIP
jgi:hypothetical protein